MLCVCRRLDLLRLCDHRCCQCRVQSGEYDPDRSRQLYHSHDRTSATPWNRPHSDGGRSCQKINIEQVLRGIGVTDVKTVNPLDLNSSVACVREMADKTGVKAIIFKSPCIAITKPEFFSSYRCRKMYRMSKNVSVNLDALPLYLTTVMSALMIRCVPAANYAVRYALQLLL